MGLRQWATRDHLLGQVVGAKVYSHKALLDKNALPINTATLLSEDLDFTE